MFYPSQWNPPTLNGADAGSSVHLSDNNRRINYHRYASQSWGDTARGLTGYSTGKRYLEVFFPSFVSAESTGFLIGVCNSSMLLHNVLPGFYTSGSFYAGGTHFAYRTNRQWGTETGYKGLANANPMDTSYGTDHVVGLGVDIPNRLTYVYVDGTIVLSGAYWGSNDTMYPFVHSSVWASKAELRTRIGEFQLAMPSDYTAWDS